MYKDVYLRKRRMQIIVSVWNRYYFKKKNNENTKPKAEIVFSWEENVTY